MKKMVKLFRLQWWHIPNLATLLRFFGAFALPFVAFSEIDVTIPESQLWTFFQVTTFWALCAAIWALICHQEFWATGLFVVTASTDKVDGFLAKAIFGTTELGAAMDASVDKWLMLLSILVALIRAAVWGDWVVFAALLALLVFFMFRESDVLKLKAAAARAENKVASARQSGRVTMVVFSVMMGVVLLPIVGPWSSAIKSMLILTTIVFSRRSWNDYKNTYGQFVQPKK